MITRTNYNKTSSNIDQEMLILYYNNLRNSSIKKSSILKFYNRGSKVYVVNKSEPKLAIRGEIKKFEKFKFIIYLIKIFIFYRLFLFISYNYFYYFGDDMTYFYHLNNFVNFAE